MLIRVDENDKVTKVRVVTGPIIAAYDTTGTLTQKYQARSKSPVTASQLVSAEDTGNVKKRLVQAKPPEWIGFLQINDLHVASPSSPARHSPIRAGTKSGIVEASCTMRSASAWKVRLGPTTDSSRTSRSSCLK